MIKAWRFVSLSGASLRPAEAERAGGTSQLCQQICSNLLLPPDKSAQTSVRHAQKQRRARRLQPGGGWNPDKVRAAAGDRSLKMSQIFDMKENSCLLIQ